MRAVLADTGPLYALSDPSDQYHARAREQMTRLGAEGYLVAVTYPTISETYTLVLRRLGAHYAHGWIEQLLDGVVAINPEPGDYQKAILLVLRYPDQLITLFDALIAVLAEKMGHPVWSYDHHFDLMRAVRWD
jgi:predicted nucleic acid-binding protein